jgi:glycosyltransferase involved in cell wall biosynthesis
VSVISFIVPAHNEEQLLGRTLVAIQTAAQASGESYEVIVADDASTDATAMIACAHEAVVVSVSHRQIAATRNAGARVARGDLLFFVDADTVVTRAAVRAAVREVRDGAVGGRCVFRFDCEIPPYARLLLALGSAMGRRLRLVGGCCLFCTREAFVAVGGFCERYFAAEEIAFLRAMKRYGRVVVPRPTVVTSGRKLSLLTVRELLALLARVAFHGPESFQRREGLDLWYGPRGVAPLRAGK